MRTHNVHKARGGVLCLVAVLCLCGPPAALAQTTTLRLSLPLSIDSPIGQNIREFARQLAARTSGAIRIEFQGQDGRYDERGVVSAVSSGAIEMGATKLNQFADSVPLAGAFLQPFLFNFDALVQAATSYDFDVRALIEKEILNRTNARVLWWLPYGSGVMLSRNMLPTNPAAIAARVVGTPDSQMRELVRVCGGVPSPVSPASTFAELQRGTIDAAATDIMNVTERALWQVADTITDLRHAPSLYMVIINEKAWQKLSSADQEILSEVAQDAQGYMWARFATIRAGAYASAVQKGMRIVELPAEDVEAWRACSAPLLEVYMERAGDAGPKLFKAYGKLRTAPCCRDGPGEAPYGPR